MTLLLALLLPLQAFAGISGCAQEGMTHAVTHVQPDFPGPDDHCNHGSPTSVHHDCGSCCCVAAAGNAGANCVAPRRYRPHLAAVTLDAPPSAAIDRLDRPPRF